MVMVWRIDSGVPVGESVARVDPSPVVRAQVLLVLAVAVGLEHLVALAQLVHLLHALPHP